MRLVSGDLFGFASAPKYTRLRVDREDLSLDWSHTCGAGGYCNERRAYQCRRGDSDHCADPDGGSPAANPTRPNPVAVHIRDGAGGRASRPDTDLGNFFSFSSEG